MSPTLTTILICLAEIARENETGPVACVWCNNRTNIIRHGTYERFDFIDDLRKIQRYLCKDDRCRRTFSILPHPFLRLSRFSLCVFNELLAMLEREMSVAAIARRLNVGWSAARRAVESSPLDKRRLDLEDDKKLDLALWRYGIVSPLLHRDAEEVRLCELLDRLDSPHLPASRWRSRGFVAGDDQEVVLPLPDRRTPGPGRQGKVGQGDAQRAGSPRRRHVRTEKGAPSLETLALLLDELVERRLWDQTSPIRSVLYRFARANNLMRDPRPQSDDLVRPFEFAMFGQVWTADFMHGPKLWLSKKKRKSYLHLIIDDCTRFVVAGRFHPSESTRVPIEELATATRRYGIVRRFYSDNGAAYNGRFEVPGCLPGSRVTVHYMPWDLSRVYYGDEMDLAREVDLAANARRFSHPNFANGKEKDNEKK